MWCRLLSKAAVLLAALMGSAAMATEPGTDTNLRERTGPPVVADAMRPANVGRNPRILVMTDTSPLCRSEFERLSKPGGCFSALAKQGWVIGSTPDCHIQILEARLVPHLVTQLAADEFPLVACLDQGEIVRSFRDGCSTPLDAWTFGWLLKGVSERPQAPIPEAIRVATTGHYPLRGNHWTVDGDTNPSKETLVTHLKSDTHVAYLKSDWIIEDWSTEELRSLHDDLHERYGPAPPVAAAPARSPSTLDQFSGSRKALGKY